MEKKACWSFEKMVGKCHGFRNWHIAKIALTDKQFYSTLAHLDVRKNNDVSFTV